MKKQVLIFLLGATIGFGSMAGIWYKALRKDPVWLAEQKAAFERDKTLDGVAESQSCDCAGEDSDPQNKGPAIDAKAPKMEKTFVFAPGGLTKVSFYSEAPVEDILGINQDVRGKLVVDLNDPNRKATGGVQLKMAGFNTGLPLRDEHFRSADFLDTEAYPEAIFEINSVKTDQKIEFGAVSHGTITGTMKLKDHTYDLKVPVKVRYIQVNDDLRKIYVQSNLLVVEGTFDLDISPLKLKSMDSLGGKKLARVIQVKIKLAGAEQAPEAPAPAP